MNEQIQVIDQNLIPHVTLKNGEKIPAMGLGTFGSDKYGADMVSKAVYGAIKEGYRFIDCAAVYQNEDRIGEVLKKIFSETDINRDDLFIVSKVWNDMHRRVKEACLKSLRDLKLSRLDLYFVHWPFPNYHAPGCDGDSRNPDSKPFSVEEFMDTWRQMEELVDEGYVRYIGMSNMTVKKLEAVYGLCRIKPSFLEMECHPAFQQPELFEYAKSLDIVPVGFCPIGSPSRPERDRTSDDIAATEMDVIKDIAKAHNVHPALICLKWAVQRGVIPIPFSVKEPQYHSNLECITTDPLTEEEMESIKKADKDCRLIKGQVFLWQGATDWRELWK
ncbi:MAG: aldo/keto reductase [Lachnospiraceae bacterium]|nr:aldo/keto reductase [Lachnospiraceae bacterium]